MRYAKIRSMDTENGLGIGVTLFVQGCHFHCKGCWNESTWDFEGGKEWTKELMNEVLNLCDRPYINHLSVLGGEPLNDANATDVSRLIRSFKKRYNDKKVWVWTGFLYEQILKTRPDLLSKIDILVDGQFDISKRNLSLTHCGSTNQRVIDVQQSLLKGEVVLYE